MNDTTTDQSQSSSQNTGSSQDSQTLPEKQNSQTQSEQQASNTAYSREGEPMSVSREQVSELDVKAQENVVIPEEEETAKNNSSAVSAMQTLPEELVKLEKETKTEEVVAAKKPLGTTNIAITLDEAKKKAKGPLIFKNSSDPMLWFSLLVIRHFQLLAQKKEEKNEHK